MIQVALSDQRYAAELRDRLHAAGGCEVRLVDGLDCECGGVMVVDLKHMGCLSGPIRNPDRVVLIARNEPEYLAKAWEAGVNSVILDKDPLSTAVLAVIAAGLRVTKCCAEARVPSREDPSANLRIVDAGQLRRNAELFYGRGFRTPATSGTSSPS